ncbi:uncharacterized protein TNCV_1813471 [Trichonephila clavipes]|uniref:Mutator-like transposase domain-containing protein n=1 Tax=Trichonephila clavipes TaxID=2585209 RepID=A0A8X6W7W5_TRICX|nr:uncharacterized protein TNCV_1813471 [Trichonephila clavipes]
MSKRCIECEHAKSGLEENSAEFHVWYEGHISSCVINHVGSSCAMEQEVALKLWQRSEDSGFQYTTLLSDGDEKTYQYLNTKEVYSPEIKIKKEECINHTEDYDLPSAMEFEALRLDTALNEMLCDAREFADEIDIQANFELIQPRHRV